MSTRQSREELIKKGLLKEVYEKGKNVKLFLVAFKHLTNYNELSSYVSDYNNILVLNHINKLNKHNSTYGIILSNNKLIVKTFSTKATATGLLASYLTLELLWLHQEFVVDWAAEKQAHIINPPPPCLTVSMIW